MEHLQHIDHHKHLSSTRLLFGAQSLPESLRRLFIPVIPSVCICCPSLPLLDALSWTPYHSISQAYLIFFLNNHLSRFLSSVACYSFLRFEHVARYFWNRVAKRRIELVQCPWQKYARSSCSS